MSDMMPVPLQPLTFPLRGSRLIEASAGTGKTFTIAGAMPIAYLLWTSFSSALLSSFAVAAFGGLLIALDALYAKNADRIRAGAGALVENVKARTAPR